MNAAETGKLLGLMAMYDYRDIGPADAAAWLKVIGDLPYADAETAVADHYAETRDRIMPADVRQRVKAMRAERLKLTPVPPPPAELIDDPEAYRRHLRESARRIADGQQPPAIGGTS